MTTKEFPSKIEGWQAKPDGVFEKSEKAGDSQMKIKNGHISLGKIQRPQAVFKNGNITVYYHNGSGISVKQVDLAAKTVTDGASTDKMYDWFAEIPLKAIGIKDNEVVVY